MSRLEQVARVLRTVRHIRFRQALAQAHFALVGVHPPVSQSGAPPTLAAMDGAVARCPVPFLPAPRLDRLEHNGDTLTFCLLNKQVAFSGAVDWAAVPEGLLFAYHVHQFDYLRSPEVSPELRRRLILDWIEQHPRGSGWDPHPTSLRILTWGRLLLEPGALELGEADGERVRSSLAGQIETLSRGVEKRLQANHLFSNLVGVVFGGLLFDGPRADAWLGFWPALRAELRSQILPDGMHEERSPMYHSLLLEQVLDLANVARAVPYRVPPGFSEEVEHAAARMLGALEIVTHPDGEIALFCDSAFGTAPPPAELRGYADALGIAARAPRQPDLLEDGGYARLESGELSLIASVAGASPAHQPGHAHCDALSFELSLGCERIVVDTGLFEYQPGARREASRATASHATIQVDDREQSEVWSAHRIGGRARVALESYSPGHRLEATCAGWATPRTTHRRSFEAEAGRIVVRDRIEGRERPVRIVFPLAPGLAVDLAHEPGADPRLVITTGAGRHVTVDLRVRGSLTWTLRETPYFPEFGRQLSRMCLFGEGTLESGEWVFGTSE